MAWARSRHRNRSTGNDNGTGGTGSQLLDFIGDELASAGRGAQNLANQFAVLVNANGPQGPYVSPDDLNGPGGNPKPPATGGSAVPVAVCVPPVCAVVPAVTPGIPGYAPANATLNSGNGGDANSGNGDKSTFWSSTKDKTPVENAYGHSTKHGDEFPQYQNSVEYVQAAQDFVNNPPEGTLIKTRSNGDTFITTRRRTRSRQKPKMVRQRRCSNQRLEWTMGINNDARERKSLALPMLREPDNWCARRV